jgi:hypothetical protein
MWAACVKEGWMSDLHALFITVPVPFDLKSPGCHTLRSFGGTGV